MDAHETIEYKGYTIQIFNDESAESPEFFGNDDLFLVGFHREFWVVRENLKAAEDMELWNRENEYEVFDLNAYIHSGVSLSLGQFHDPWDSGQVGYVIVKKDAGWQTPEGEKGDAGIRSAAESLVGEWNHYLEGNVWGYVILDPDGNDDESCWGFYGDPDKYVLEEAKRSVDFAAEERHMTLMTQYS